MRSALSIIVAAALLGTGSLAIPSPAWALTVNEVVGLLRSGVGERVILAQMDAEGAVFRLQTEEIVSLKEAGASDDLLREMIRTGAEPEPSPASASSGESGKPDEPRPGDASSGDRTDEYSSDLDRTYAAPSVGLGLSYDPFGYYWYAWPWSYAYYYPFSWVDSGFYYAGWWNSRWWRGGSYCNWYNYNYCQPYWQGWNHHYSYASYPQGGRSAWDRARGHGGTGSRAGAFAVRSSDRDRRSSAYDQRTSRGSRPEYGRLPDRGPRPPRSGDSRIVRPNTPARPDRGGYSRPSTGHSRPPGGITRPSGGGFSRGSGGSSRPSGGAQGSRGGGSRRR